MTYVLTVFAPVFALDIAIIYTLNRKPQGGTQ